MSRLSKLLDRLPIEMLLIALVVVSYWRVQRLWFVYDDAMYIFAAEHIQHGLNLADIKWALTSTYAANWHPLTWISYMADTQLAGMNPRQFHLTNLLIHIGSMLLLFLLLNRTTKSVWKSAFVAALFGVHPLHVESVAWVAERKDVLSALFWMLTLWTYVSFTQRRSLRTYLPVLLCFVLGLASKPMLVTLPFTLLLLDYWPLGRMKGAGVQRSTFNVQGSTSDAPSTKHEAPSTNLRTLILEKLPLFILAAVSCAVTYIAQSTGGAFGIASNYPLGIRLMNVPYAYVMYIWKMIVPVNLAVFYPHPGHTLAIWKSAACLLLLIAITVLALGLGKKRPYVPFGWLWYLGTLVPVIGFIQVGNQGMADRYTYIPLIGLFVMIAWGVPEIFGKKSGARSQESESGDVQGSRFNVQGSTPGTRNPKPGTLILPTMAVMLILTLAILTRIQVRSWLNNATLFGRASRVVANNYEAHSNFGASLQSMGDNKGALAEYETAVRIAPNIAPIRFNVGVALISLGRFKEAEAALKKALEIDPNYAPAHNNLGTIYARQGKVEEAFEHLDRAIEIEPNYADAHNNYGNLLDSLGREDEALGRYEDAIAVDPKHPDARYNKGVVLYKMGRTDEAIEAYKEAVKLKPSYAEAHKNLATTYFMTGRYEEAWAEVHLAVKYGGKPHPELIRTLTERMPDPGK